MAWVRVDMVQSHREVGWDQENHLLVRVVPIQETEEV